MKLYSIRISRGLKTTLGFALLMIPLFLFTRVQAGNLTLSTSFSYNNGYYIYTETLQTYYMNLGLRYTEGDLMISGYVPFIMQNDIFADAEQTDYNDPYHMGETMKDHTYNSGIGDVFLYGEYRIFQPLNAAPTVYLTAQIKIPTSAALSLFSTGEFDYGAGLALRQWFGSYYGFANAGYLVLGNPPGIEYRNPFSFGIGAGKFFLQGRYSINLYYRAYSEIISGVQPPQQLSLGLSAALSRSTYTSLYLIKGFSESSPNFALTAVLEWAL